MSGNSSVGPVSTHGAGDQRNAKDGEEQKPERFEEGKENAHDPNDPKDERSIANRLANETSKKDDEDEGKSKEDKLRDIDATLPAISHGNKPSRGAIIDQELREEEEEILKKKGSFGPKT